MEAGNGLWWWGSIRRKHQQYQQETYRKWGAHAEMEKMSISEHHYIWLTSYLMLYGVSKPAHREPDKVLLRYLYFHLIVRLDWIYWNGLFNHKQILNWNYTVNGWDLFWFVIILLYFIPACIVWQSQPALHIHFSLHLSDFSCCFFCYFHDPWDKTDNNVSVALLAHCITTEWINMFSLPTLSFGQCFTHMNLRVR